MLTLTYTDYKGRTVEVTGEYCLVYIDNPSMLVDVATYHEGPPLGSNWQVMRTTDAEETLAGLLASGFRRGHNWNSSY